MVRGKGWSFLKFHLSGGVRVENLEGDWLHSEWFGFFKYYEKGWLFHDSMGWLFSSPSLDGAVWPMGRAIWLDMDKAGNLALFMVSPESGLAFAD